MHGVHQDSRRGRARRPAHQGGPDMKKDRFSIIGQSLPKIDAWAKVVGETKFADDLLMSRMAHGKLLRSPHPHALIKRIDTTRARALPGVYAVITGHDLPRVKFGILPVSQDEEALCVEKVRMVGDAVAAVAAVDEETAERATELIEVEYEPLRPLMSIEDSLAHPEVRIHEYGDRPNVHKAVSLQFGNVEAAFAASDLVREDVFYFEGNTHLPMEQHSALAQWGADGKLTLWSSTQTPHYVQRLLSRILDVPQAHIRVVAAPVGGGFGGKLEPFAHEIAACKLSQLTGRPVKFTLTREEVFYVHRGRHPVLMWIKTGFTKDGAITGMHFRSWLDGGAYGSYGVASGWREKRGSLPPGKGIGIACSSYLTGAGTAIYWNDMPHSGVVVRADRSGLVAVLCGATDIGQGSDSILAYLVAEVLGIEPKDIRVHPADTDLTPVDLGSYSSRVTLMAGNAAIQAAERLRAKILDAVATKLEVGSDTLVMRDRRIFVDGDPDRGVSFAQAVVHAESRFGVLAFPGSYAPPKRAGKYKGGGVGPSPCYSYSACVVEMDVDVETGEVKPREIWIAHDVGRALNPLLVEGQVEGSVYMGLGEVLMEEQVFRKGVHKFPSMLEYKSPTTLETPEIHTILIETDDPEGPYGAKEAGQGPLLPVIPAVANAVHDAVGVRIDEIPVTPDKVLKALDLKRQGKTPRVGPEKLPLFTFPEPRAVESAFGLPAENVAVRPFGS